jgi:hypothetical protein
MFVCVCVCANLHVWLIIGNTYSTHSNMHPNVQVNKPVKQNTYVHNLVFHFCPGDVKC